MFAHDSLSARADAFLRTHPSVLAVSDLAAAEFASAFARRVRMKLMTADEARSAFATFDTWVARETGLARIDTADLASAAAFLRRLDLTLRTADAIHIAIAQRIDAELLTFDDTMTASARALGTSVLNG